ncbi:MAG: cell division protein FtsQ/DivIB [Burkholderiales bacterium]|uniref:cell division protein FtsQ/DivIB n=1 Tax=Inhella sp. TaxID=1921806 RepID=UPI001AD3878C|nr:cell division protein FtsQ/DivIB [Burkholderiales bacterium]
MREPAAMEPLPPDIRWMRRSTRVLAVLAAVLLLALAAMWLARASAFDWRQLRIEGDAERHSVAHWRANTLPHLQGNFLTVSLPQVREVFESQPWIRRADVRRVWPAQLVVTLQEHRAVALWDGRGEYGEPPLERALLNEHAEVFQVNLGDVEEEALPQLAGPTGSEASVLQMWRRLAPLVRAKQLEPQRLELSGRGSWRLLLEGGASIELGRGEGDALVARFDRFLGHAQSLARQFNTQIRSADLRHPGGYALRLVGIGTKPTPEPSKKPRKT